MSDGKEEEKNKDKNAWRVIATEYVILIGAIVWLVASFVLSWRISYDLHVTEGNIGITEHELFLHNSIELITLLLAIVAVVGVKQLFDTREKTKEIEGKSKETREMIDQNVELLEKKSKETKEEIEKNIRLLEEKGEEAKEKIEQNLTSSEQITKEFRNGLLDLQKDFNRIRGGYEEYITEERINRLDMDEFILRYIDNLYADRVVKAYPLVKLRNQVEEERLKLSIRIRDMRFLKRALEYLWASPEKIDPMTRKDLERLAADPTVPEDLRKNAVKVLDRHRESQ